MYVLILKIHSILRLLVIIVVLASTLISYFSYKNKSEYTQSIKSLISVTSVLIIIQLVFGIYLYTVSPLVKSFWNDVSNNIHQRELRFFGIEHSLMMLLSVLIMLIGIYKAKKENKDNKKLKVLFIWFFVGVVILLFNIPWEFSPLVSRPTIRWF